VQGAKLAAEIVNGSHPSIPLPLGPGTGIPALDDAELRLFTADSRGEPVHGSQQAADLAGRNVAGIVGAYDVAVTQAASQRTERSGVPWINGDASARYLTDLGMDWFFRIGPSDRTFGEAFFSMLRQQEARGLTVRRIAVVRMDDEASNDIYGVVEQLAGEGGLEVGVDVPVESGNPDLPTAAVRELRDARPDAAVLVASSVQDAVKLAKALRAASYAPPAMMTLGRGFDAASFDTAVGDDGWLHPRAWSAEVAARNPTANAVAELYQQRYKTPMTETAACSFTAVLTLAQAVQNAGSVQPARVRAALLALDVTGSDLIMPWNGIEFDDNRQNVRAAGVIEQSVGGRPRVVFPIELARTAVSWPGPQ
jgi:branched-chain amino acid transport system substrate-binding protein